MNPEICDDDIRGKGKVVVFLSPDCPLCQSYMPTLNKIRDQYISSGIIVITVFPGKFISPDSIEAFVDRYGWEGQHIKIDSTYSWTESFGATVTPEVFLMDSICDVVYKGRIDDLSYETGKKKLFATSHDLLNAINSLVKGEKILVDSTRAIGCLIE